MPVEYGHRATMGFVATRMLDDPRQESRASDSKPFDISVIDEWAAHLRRSQGWADSSVERAAKRLRAFTRATPSGLFQATQMDVFHFAQRQAHRETARAGRPADFNSYIRGEGWRKVVAALQSFYSWAENVRGLGWSAGNPLRGMRRFPPVRRQGGVSRALARCYDRLLALEIRSDRDRALTWLLAHGLRVSEVVALQPADVDLGGGKVRVRGRRDRTRLVPIGARGIQMIRAWVTERQRGRYIWLFPGPNEDHHAALTLPNQVVQRLAEEALPQRPSVRRRINADGLRQLFLTRALARRASLFFIAETLGIDRLTTAVRCLPVGHRSAHRELERIRRPWKAWI
jgi:site-specific recombinase XerD